MKQVNLKIQATGKVLQDWHKGVFQYKLTEINLVRGKLDTLVRLPFDSGQFEQQKELNKQLQELVTK